uniref:Reverse transcriptase n=1 Tax=Takifugu rubripes TaxID=31033 RepID=Q76IN2_TAKRU|nr:reverse transcriptase [Takifugu rubripes]
MSTIIVSYGSERFGRIEKGNTETTSYTMNRRSFKIHQLRKELRTLKKQFKRASDGDKQALKELYNILRKKLKTLRRAEWHRRRGRERARKRAAFIANPFRFSKQLLGDKRSGRLECSREEVDRFLQNTMSDPLRGQDLGPNRALISPAPPSAEFKLAEPSLKEVKEAVMAARSSSSPGPSGVPYRVYKQCPKLLVRFWKIMKVIWRRGRVTTQWRSAEGVWIPKEEDASKIEQFRIISLLCVEGKIFFKIVSQRLTDFLLKNNYIDTSVQTGGIPGVPGCLEHNGVVTQLIREAHESKGELAVLWLDLTNAYGSIPHKLVEIALHLHHVPSKIKDLILDYYDDFRLRVTTGSLTSTWQCLEKGIITGCTISVPLFSLAMNIIVKSAEVECRGPLSRSGTRQPPIRAFMDDLTVMTTSVPGCRWLLQGLERLISWARMSFKPAKSWSLVLRKGKVADRFCFALGETPIPMVTEKPVKILGKVFNSSLRDSDALLQAKADLTSWLTAIDKSGLPGKFKTWIYQHGVLPRLLWPLLVYKVPMSTVETLKQNISQFLRRWLGFPQSLSSIALYGHSTMLQLPISGLSEEFMVTHAREQVMYWDSSDTKVATAGILVKTGRKWEAQKAVDRAEARLEARLQHNILVGNTAGGRAGLGSFPIPRYDKARGREKRSMVQDEIRAEVEEDRRFKMVAMYQQGAWTRWEHAEQRKLTWPELWRLKPQHIKFLIQSVYDVLPSPTNLQRWGLAATAACQLCKKRATHEHILSCCPKASGDGRYRWCHDQVLRTLADTVSAAINNCKYQNTPKQSITFVRAGEKAQQQPSSFGGLLTTARHWKLQVDLGRQLNFPEHISATSLCPDMVLTSESMKQVVLVELTVPWEDRLEEANERKRAKYANLVIECQNNGWKARCEPVEVGCRGFAGQSLPRTLKLLGVKGQLCRRAIKTIVEAAEKASRWLWIRRGDPWSSGPLGRKSGADRPRLGRPSECV